MLTCYARSGVPLVSPTAACGLSSVSVDGLDPVDFSISAKEPPVCWNPSDFGCVWVHLQQAVAGGPVHLLWGLCLGGGLDGSLGPRPGPQARRASSNGKV